MDLNSNMVDVFWLHRCAADLPSHDAWLSERESYILRGLRFAKRRADWRLGRWTAKRAVAAYLELQDQTCDLATVEIIASASGAPEVFVEGRPAPVVISLSHRDAVAICTIAERGTALGCDLEAIESRSEAFVADYFTNEEQALLGRGEARQRPRLTTLLWSAKESALKALQEGLRLDTRSVQVDVNGPTAGRAECDAAAWQPLSVRHASGIVFHGWWQSDAGAVRTIVAAPAPRIPVLLFGGGLRRAAAGAGNG